MLFIGAHASVFCVCVSVSGSYLPGGILDSVPLGWNEREGL